MKRLRVHLVPDIRPAETKIITSSIDKVLRDAVDRGAVPNVAAIAADAGDIIYQGAAGSKQVDGTEPVTVDTQYRIMSMTHPHLVRAKSGYRRLYVSDELDRLYGEYVWQLCEAGADLATDDFDASYIFVNLDHEPRFAPWRPDSVYDLVDRLRRQLAGQVPKGWTPHWYRHSHATALLLSGVPVHVVSHRLGHADVQTTLNTYAHVTEDAELRAVADWKALTAGWRTALDATPLSGSCS